MCVPTSHARGIIERARKCTRRRRPNESLRPMHKLHGDTVYWHVGLYPIDARACSLFIILSYVIRPLASQPAGNKYTFSFFSLVIFFLSPERLIRHFRKGFRPPFFFYPLEYRRPNIKAFHTHMELDASSSYVSTARSCVTDRVKSRPVILFLRLNILISFPSQNQSYAIY